MVGGPSTNMTPRAPDAMVSVHLLAGEFLALSLFTPTERLQKNPDWHFAGKHDFFIFLHVFYGTASLFLRVLHRNLHIFFA